MPGLDMRKHNGRTSQEGIALLVVLWIMAVLIVVVLSFSLMMRKESQAVLFFKEGVEKKYYAEAAIERAVIELYYRNLNRDQDIIYEGKEVFKVDGTVYPGRIGDGNYNLKIMNEAGRINVNEIGDDTGILLKNLLMNSGTAEELAVIIVDSVLDWKDEDDLHRLHGAESDFYQAMSNPYKARNAPFESLEELVMVRGMTPEILFGSADKAGLIQFLTVHSKTGKIDIGSASKEVLMAVPGMTVEAAERVIEYRKTAEIRDMASIKEVIGSEIFLLLEPFAAVIESTTYTIEAIGYKDNERKGYPIRATVILHGPGGYRYLYYKSPAENRL